MSVPKPDLKNKPLIEAIFELRWELQQKEPAIKIDPHYRILLGRFFDNVVKEYPYHEELASAGIPDEFVGYTVQHRFRKAKNKWPLVQIGPGLVTLNDTEEYTWKDFVKRANKLLSILFKTYPKRKELKFNMILLRYIDGIEFDFNKDHALNFLQEKMKTKIDIHPNLFDGTGVQQLPFGLNLKLTYLSKQPKGAILLSFKRGSMKNKDAIIWETAVQSHGKEVPKAEKSIKNWITKAHTLSDDWFFKIIEGELFERFK